VPRSLLSLSDLDAAEILALFRRAEDAAGDPVGISRALEGRLVAGLFHQPAPRTEAALRAACARLGATFASGDEAVRGFANMDLSDAAEAAGAFADILVLRHPLEGAARAAAAVAGVPVLNAGDGAREDPLHGLLSLRGLVARRGEKPPRAVALCGDLRHNRLSHSLASGLAALGTTVLLVPARGAEMPDHQVARFGRRHGGQPLRFPAQALRTILDMVDTVVVTPGVPYQHPLFAGLPEGGDGDLRRARAAVEHLDAIFVAAGRCEDGSPAAPEASPEGHPWTRDDGRVVHPPFGRTPGSAPPPAGELRAQATREVPLVAELVLLAAGAEPEGGPEEAGSPEGMRCPHPRCVSRRDRRFPPRYEVVRREPLVLECRYCGVPAVPRFAASRVERRYHAIASSEVRKILPGNLVLFGRWEEAEEAGFQPARRASPDAAAAEEP
jgi:aspartate carbamoyltransferase catalytic subunit